MQLTMQLFAAAFQHLLLVFVFINSLGHWVKFLVWFGGAYSDFP